MIWYLFFSKDDTVSSVEVQLLKSCRKAHKNPCLFTTTPTSKSPYGPGDVLLPLDERTLLEAWCTQGLPYGGQFIWNDSQAR